MLEKHEHDCVLECDCVLVIVLETSLLLSILAR